MLLLHATNWNISADHIGREFSTAWSASNYWQQKESFRCTPAFGGGGNLDHATAGSRLRTLDDLIRQGVESRVSQELRFRSELLKELLLEEVRVERASAKPSRKRALFAFDAEVDVTQYLETLKLSGRTLVRIQTDPEALIHRGRLSLLDCNVSPIAEIRAKAVEYWDGVEAPEQDSEVLVVGPFRIVEKIEI